MPMPDFNLLLALDELLAEGSVARAARRLHLSPSAMSRTLARLRDTMGDPLLVRAGRGLVPTPRALALKEEVRLLVQQSAAVLRPLEHLNLKTLERTFTLRAREGFVETFGPGLLSRLSQDAPGVRLHFLLKPDKDSAPLRDGTVDLEVGVVGSAAGPEVLTQALFRDRFVGVVRPGHPLTRGKITVSRYVGGRHIGVARRGLDPGVARTEPVDAALSSLGLARDLVTLVGSFSTALALARVTDLIATVPERHSGVLRNGLHSFRLPVAVPEITLSLLWHPRQDADLAHEWLRRCLRDVCAGRRLAVDS